MAETRRLFIAVPVPDYLQKFFQQQEPLLADEAIRFVPAANWHLTVLFLGEVPVHQLPTITTALQHVAEKQVPFTLHLDKLEPGPKLTAPRLIWARFAAHPAFNQLCAVVTSQLSIPPPKSFDYIPHITLARFRKGVTKPLSVPTIIPSQPINLPVTSLALWQSELRSPHPIYRILVQYPLTGT